MADEGFRCHDEGIVDRMLRPAQICRDLLAALEVSEGRRRRRKRDTTADAIGLEIKRSLLGRAIAADPEPAQFEGWLLAQSLDAAPAVSTGATHAMALEIFTEWRLAASVEAFQGWLERGAPSDDRPQG